MSSPLEKNEIYIPWSHVLNNIIKHTKKRVKICLRARGSEIINYIQKCEYSETEGRMCNKSKLIRLCNQKPLNPISPTYDCQLPHTRRQKTPKMFKSLLLRDIPIIPRPPSSVLDTREDPPNPQLSTSALKSRLSNLNATCEQIRNLFHKI